MSEKMKKLLAAINKKKEEIKALVEQHKLDDAESAKAELDKMQREFNLLMDLDDGEADEAAAQAQKKKLREVEGSGGSDKAKTHSFDRITSAFVNALGARVGRRQCSDDDRQVLRDAAATLMVEGNDQDGGFTVPKDIQTRINELRRTEDDLSRYVNVEPVSTLTGSRVIELEADAAEWPDIDEDGEYKEAPVPQLKAITYKVTKKGGTLKTTLELLSDSSENIAQYLMKWAAKKSRATRNSRILKVIDEITEGKEVEISDLDGLKRVFNIMLDPAITTSSKVLTNQTGYNWLDTLKDKVEGKYVLQPDPTDKTRDLLFGKYPIVKLSDKVFKSVVTTGDNTTTEKVPLVCGDLAEAVTLFDREYMTMEASTVAGDNWERDRLAIKCRERFDTKAVDTGAIIKAVVTLTTAG